MVMGMNLGSSFRKTLMRVAGVVIGSIVPTLFKFCLDAMLVHAWAHEQEREDEDAQPRDLIMRIMHPCLRFGFLFGWVTLGMYIKYTDSYASYAGNVAAYIAIGIFMDSEFGTIDPAHKKIQIANTPQI